MTYPNEAKQSEGWIEEGLMQSFTAKGAEANLSWWKVVVARIAIQDIFI